MRFRSTVLAACLMGASLASGSVHSAMITIVGTDFDVVYDDTKLGQFGAPTLTGDTLYFTPNNFRAESLNGQGVVTDNSTLNGLTLVAHAGFHFGSLSMAEFGDYIMTGASSSVTVGGQLRAFDAFNSILTQTSNSLVVNGATPLNLIDGLNHDWVAGASITNATPTIIPGSSPWLAGASQVGLTLENNLSAFTASTDTGPLRAMVEKKFNGVAITVQPVPVPAAVWLLGSGLCALGVCRGRRASRMTIALPA